MTNDTLVREVREPNREARRAEASNKRNPKLKRRYGPARGTHHIDRRADQLAAAGTDTTPISEEDMISTSELARWLGVSPQWCEIGRSRGYGPPWKRLSEKCIRYRRGDVRAWLAARASARVAKQVEA